ncbi:Short-chain dehydrogenase/reductase SDR [Sulfitobacter noctilucicola]|uniref:NADP-dependent 3-hydroxy acid dehydrogenase YdfG n=1 Tax=Sulfitobacter noctilucicola TaxID=1342301 RepID=A0A7W6Q4L7_9RHOB|nr:SDR family oxidoreductase [Sulfitobacter noctilucicola]KIN63701.1 Short-chain dehydrogenase/reductase SDR [Sulfitobacter noctilucicola]MBB4174788.1 NADP-dependent 3-hydroxy acid dehydrogenase YdfG [Sulfitobacter noctilucicola]
MKRIVITGASSGVGRATAELFLQEGWHVGLIARRADILNEMAAEHENAVALPADVTDATALEQAFTEFGPLDVLFNNAGMFGPSAPIDEIAIADWEQVMMVNLHGMFLAARLAFAAMRKNAGGRIINNGSISAHTPRPGSVCYTTTKHAITGMTKSLSLDGRPFDIACGQIDIGNAETEMVAGLKKISPETHTMDVAHAANAVLHMATLPPEANVQFMTVMATKMPFIGRG